MNFNSLPLEVDDTVRRIVVVNTAFLGDLVLTIPFVSVLKQKFPRAKVVLVCKKGIGDFFLKLNLVDEIQEVKKGSAKDYSSLVDRINKEINDYVFCIHRSFRSYLLTIRIQAKKRVGYRLGFNFFGYDSRVKRDLSLPESLRIMQLLTLVDHKYADYFVSAAKLQDLNSKDKELRMIHVPEWAKFPDVAIPSLSDKDNAAIFDSLKKTVGVRKLIAVFPGSVWNTKRWPIEYFTDLVQQLTQMDCRVVLMGGPGEEEFGDEIQKKIKDSDKVINWIGKTSVWESILILNQCDMVIANDSASSHLAALLGKKILVFFGPTVLKFGYRPWGNSVYVLENESLSCRPCGSHGHHKCPIGTHECMKSITPMSAVNKVREILSLD